MTTDTTTASMSRKPTKLALEFRADSLALFALGSLPEWQCVFVVPLDTPEFEVQVLAMRRHATDLTGDPSPRVELWLPAEQVLNTEISKRYAIYDLIGKRRAISAAVAECTTIPQSDLYLVDTPARAAGHAISVTERAVVEEAKSYARRWGFRPARITSRHAHPAFATWPTFGGLHRFAVPAAAAAVIIVGAGLVWAGLLADSGSDRIDLAALSDTPPTAQFEAAILPRTAPVGADRSPVIEDLDTAFAAQFADMAVASPPGFDRVNTALITGEPVDPVRLSLLGGEALAAEPDTDNAAQPVSASMSAYLLTALPDALRDPVTPVPVSVANTPTEPPSDTNNDAQAITLAALPDATAPTGIPVAPPAVTSIIQPHPDIGETGPSIGSVGQSDRNDPRATGVTPAVDTAIADDQEPEANAPIAAIVPAERPTEIEERPSELAVTNAPLPRPRPAELDLSPSDLALATAPQPKTRPRSIKPKVTTIIAATPSTTGAKTVRAPSRAAPAGPGAANAATLKDAIQLEELNLLGVFGSKDSRRALLRLPDGQVMRVKQGSVIDGWVISRITATSMRITRGGTAETLTIVR
ncbi:MAG: hypothetical protein AAF367_18560 [Pseudomonadota bacterium]